MIDLTLLKHININTLKSEVLFDLILLKHTDMNNLKSD